MPNVTNFESIIDLNGSTNGVAALRSEALRRYQINFTTNGRGQIRMNNQKQRQVIDDKSIRRLNFVGKYLISPAFLFSSLGVMLFFPDTLLRKVMAPFANLRLWEKAGKRLFDILGSILGFIMLSVFFIMIPFLILFDSRGPVIYKQKRIGLNHRFGDRRRIRLQVMHDRRQGERRKNDLFGRPFWVYKFRTMRQDAEKTSGAMWAQENDPRITTMGRILRFTHIDEIPQFFNVLCGEMSLVGPRPERPELMPEIIAKVPDFPNRLQVKPGMTGPAQIVCGYDTTIDAVKEKLHYDLVYVRKSGLKEDIVLLFQTFWVIIRGKEVLDS
ncbi:MAG: sugar transferase [Deferribacteres bacterium]|nr:sugar transferase [Deferribacteres bacterium]